MRPKIVDLLNRAFGTGLFGWLVPTPEVMYALAMLVVLAVFVTRCRADGLKRYHALGAAMWAMVGGLIGARILYLLLRLDRVVHEPAMLVDLRGSTMSWGAYFGAGLGFALYFARHGVPFGRYADALASTIGLGPFIARFACFLNGDDFGSVTSVAWAVSYPHDSFAFATQVRQGLLSPSGAESLPVHPVQIYLAASGLALFILFSWLWRRRLALQPGALFFLYWAADGATRFGLEFFRGDIDRTFIGRFPDAQVIAMVVCVVAVAAFVGRQAPVPATAGNLNSPLLR